jgi:hypothetical protein
MEGSDDSKAGTSNAVHAELATPGHPDVDIPDVTWWEHAGLRHLYFMMPILFLGNSLEEPFA